MSRIIPNAPRPGPHAFIGVDYDEGIPDSYRAVTVKIGDKVTRFTGPPLAAFRQASDFAHRNAATVYELSSVDHYAADLRLPTGWGAGE